MRLTRRRPGEAKASQVERREGALLELRAHVSYQSCHASQTQSRGATPRNACERTHKPDTTAQHPSTNTTLATVPATCFRLTAIRRDLKKEGARPANGELWWEARELSLSWFLWVAKGFSAECDREFVRDRMVARCLLRVEPALERRGRRRAAGGGRGEREGGRSTSSSVHSSTLLSSSPLVIAVVSGGRHP